MDGAKRRLRAWPTARGLALSLLVLLAVSAVCADDDTEREIARYRSMLQEDPWANPGLLDADRGEALWKEKRGPNAASLEGCDLGKGRGVVAGAYAELPRHFADANRVMDLEARLVWCMETLQGFSRTEILERPYSEANQPGTELEALATFVAVKSRGSTFAPPTAHAEEQAAIAQGEALFFRRQGPMDFSCSTCHGKTGKRIRLQALPFLSNPEDARKVIGEWPAYRVSQGTVMTMQHRLADCFWQMRLPRIDYASTATIALTSYLVDRARGGEITAPSIKR
jgi:L-cysteine S-thiosulfotransferase